MRRELLFAALALVFLFSLSVQSQAGIPQLSPQKVPPELKIKGNLVDTKTSLHSAKTIAQNQITVDPFGYIYCDSQDPGGCCTFNFEDISTAGGIDTGINGDDVSATVPIGFDFTFYGQSYNTVLVSSNGYLTFGTYGNDFSNDCIPNTSDPNALIAPFWDDQTCNNANGEHIWYLTQGTEPDRYLIIQFRTRDYGEPLTTPPYEYQVKLFEGSNRIEFHYQAMVQDTDAGQGQGATVGIENETGDYGVQYLCDGQPAQNLIEDSLAVCFFQQPNVYINPSNSLVYALPGQDAYHGFEITNLTGIGRTFYIDYSQYIWNTSGPSNTGPIENGETLPINVIVSTPQNAKFLDKDKFHMHLYSSKAVYEADANGTTVICYDWEEMAPMPYPRNRHAVVEWGGKLFVIGGQSNLEYQPYDGRVQVYEPGLNQWFTNFAPMPVPVSNIDAAVVGEDIYVVGGYENGTGTLVRNVQKYNIPANAWADVGPDFPGQGLLGASMEAIGNNIYYIGGGYISGYEIYGSNQLWRYNTTKGTWTQLQSFTQGRYFHRSAVINGMIYIWGGIRDTLSGQILKSVEIYNPIFNIWTSGPPMERAAAGHAGTGVSETILKTSGFDEMNYLLFSEAYKPTVGATWTQFRPHNIPFRTYSTLGYGYINQDVYVYLMGGYDVSNLELIGKNERMKIGAALTPVPTATPTNTPTPSPTNTPTSTPTYTPTDTPTPIPTNTPTPIPTDTPTEIPSDTPTPIPTDTPTEIPSEIPTDTPTPIPTDTPTEIPTDTPTEIPNNPPVIAVAGYLATYLQANQDSDLTIWAYVTDPDGDPISRVNLYYQGSDTGLSLIDNGMGVYSFSAPIPGGAAPQGLTILLELKAFDTRGGESRLWPYLDVPAASSYENLFSFSDPEFIWSNEFMLKLIDHLNPTPRTALGPFVAVGGYWDTNITSSGGGDFVLLCYVMDLLGVGVNRVHLFFGGGDTNVPLLDDGTQHDFGPGDKVYGIYIPGIAPGAIPPAKYLLELKAWDNAGNESDLWPWLIFH